MRVFARLLPLMLLAAACTERPHAPPLSNDPVYLNEAIGLRFLVPDGWTVVSRANLPPGKLDHPVVLVTYLQSRADKPAEFELMAADLPAETNLATFLADYRIGPEKWVVKPAAETVTVNGVSATRYTMSRGTGKAEFRREVTVFQRGSRSYFFAISYSVGDPDRRDQARKSVESATWNK